MPAIEQMTDGLLVRGSFGFTDSAELCKGVLHYRFLLQCDLALEEDVCFFPLSDMAPLSVTFTISSSTSFAVTPLDEPIKALARATPNQQCHSISPRSK